MFSNALSLVSCYILEKDINDDILWTWVYPKINEEERNIISRKCTLDGSTSNTLIYGRLNQNWFYTVATEASKLPRVKVFSIVIVTKEYDPDKHERLCEMLNKTYLNTGSPIEVQKLYWSLYTKGYCKTLENETFSFSSFKSTPKDKFLRDLILNFQLEIILIYTAMLLKKRIIVYHHNINEILKWIKTFPKLLALRNPSDYIYPHIDFVPEEIIQLKSSNNYIAGVTDNSICSKPELYDLLVNIPAQEITISPKSKEYFTMTKIHKDIALCILQNAEDRHLSEEQISQNILDKTKELLTQLRSMTNVSTNENGDMISLEFLRSKDLSTAVENFLFNLAVAENIMML